jgi:hypothetical protein
MAVCSSCQLCQVHSHFPTIGSTRWKGICTFKGFREDREWAELAKTLCASFFYEDLSIGATLDEVYLFYVPINRCWVLT